MTKSLIKANIKGGKLCNEKIQQAVIDLRAEFNLEQERNINNISCDNEYMSPMKKENLSTINDSVYYESDEHAYTISDSIKPVDASNEPITDTHIVKGINNLLVVIVSVNLTIIGVGIIGQGITKGVINGITDRDDRLGYTHYFETMSKTTAYRNHIRIRKLKLEKFLSGKLRALRIFNGHCQ